jgi:hypothetical protein
VNRYLAYGLCIQSDLRLPELVFHDTSEPDVVVRLGHFDCPPLEPDADGGASGATAEEAWRVLPEVGRFWVRRGREIVVDLIPEVDERMVRLALLGPALGILLHQRGRFILHASTIERGSQAIAVAAGSGWGKSTLAATLHSRGWGLVADDLTAIAMSPDRPSVVPGFPQIKLWPEAARSLGQTPDTMPQLHPLVDKRAHREIREFAHDPLPLARIYVLAEGPSLEVEPLHQHDAMIQLTRYWYGARFGDRLLRAHGARRVHFLRCATLAQRVTVRRLQRPSDLQALHDLADLVEDDLANAAEIGTMTET